MDCALDRRLLLHQELTPHAGRQPAWCSRHTISQHAGLTQVTGRVKPLLPSRDSASSSSEAVGGRQQVAKQLLKKDVPMLWRTMAVQGAELEK